MGGLEWTILISVDNRESPKDFGQKNRYKASI